MACGGEEQPPKTAVDVSEPEPETNSPGFSASSDIGGLNYEKVDRTFAEALDELQACLNEGAQRIEFLGGGVSFFVKVNANGKLSNAYLEESTLGDRITERCMLDALRSQTWPKPIGGEMGLARKSFDFDPPNDVRPPTQWSEEPLDESLREVADKLNDCKSGTHGTFTATMYVDTDGRVLAAGVACSDESGESAADCLADALLASTFPSPGSWPAKLSFEL